MYLEIFERIAKDFMDGFDPMEMAGMQKIYSAPAKAFQSWTKMGKAPCVWNPEKPKAKNSEFLKIWDGWGGPQVLDIHMIGPPLLGWGDNFTEQNSSTCVFIYLYIYIIRCISGVSVHPNK